MLAMLAPLATLLSKVASNNSLPAYKHALLECVQLSLTKGRQMLFMQQRFCYAANPLLSFLLFFEF